jgi:hypothetical protein
MKVATLHQFWATAMALGLKQTETRSRRINYRGLLAIHSAKTIPQYARDAWWSNRMAREAIQAQGYRTIDDLPLGKILCVVNVVDCIGTDSRVDGGCPDPLSLEFWMGDYRPGRWAWITEGCQRLIQPIPYSGNQTIHDLPSAILEQVRAQLPETAISHGV